MTYLLPPAVRELTEVKELWALLACEIRAPSRYCVWLAAQQPVNLAFESQTPHCLSDEWEELDSDHLGHMRRLPPTHTLVRTDISTQENVLTSEIQGHFQIPLLLWGSMTSMSLRTNKGKDFSPIQRTRSGI